MDDGEFGRPMETPKGFDFYRHHVAFSTETEDVLALHAMEMAAWEISVTLETPLARVEAMIRQAIQTLFPTGDRRAVMMGLATWVNVHRRCCMDDAVSRMATRSYQHLSAYGIAPPVERAIQMYREHVETEQVEAMLERRERHWLERPPSRRGVYPVPTRWPQWRLLLDPQRARRCRSPRFADIPFDFASGHPARDS